MSPERSPRPSNINQGPQGNEAVIRGERKLQYISKSLEFLHSNPDNTEGAEKAEHWTELYKQVSPYGTGLELSDNVREVVRANVAEKIPDVKEKVPSMRNLPDDRLLNALTNNWFEELPEAQGQRREVLLAVMANVIKRIETTVYKKVIGHAPEEDLHTLGLDATTRDLAVRLLDTSSKANALFIRFMAYAQLSGKPPEGATLFAMHVPGEEQLHTIADLFPRETAFLSRRFLELAEEGSVWEEKPGSSQFREYLHMLGNAYAEKDPAAAEALHHALIQKCADATEAGFPIVVTPGLEGYKKEPYIDPELRVSFVTEDSARENVSFKRAQEALAASAEHLGIERFQEAMQEKSIQSVVAVGSFGVNLIFNGVAQSEPTVLLYLNEQSRQYDKPYVGFIQQHVAGGAEAFADTGEGDGRALQEHMSRMNTILHELGHPPYENGVPESERERLGRRPRTILDEIKADSIYRALLPSLIEKGGVEGTKEQWAISSLASALQYLKDSDDVSDPYFSSGMYTLNAVLRSGAVSIEGDKVIIKDPDGYFEALDVAAREVLAIYENRDMTERKASQWIAEHCAVDEQTTAFIALLK